MNHVFEIDSVQLEFSGRKILSAVYLACKTGTATGLLGRNGAGKSCLMKIIYGSLPCERSIRFDGVFNRKRFMRPDMLRYMPQFHFIPASLSLRRVCRDFGLSFDEFQSRFPEFAGRANSAISNLSGGERRLVELYVIVKSKSQFTMLDEPFTHLNPLQIEKAKELIAEEKKHKGILITDHMYKHVLDICDTLYILANGQTYLAKSLADIERFGYARL